MDAVREFPERGAYRGLTSGDFFDDDERRMVNAGAFQFDVSSEREDGYAECSINWIDDDGALACIARQTKVTRDGDRAPQFSEGACRLPLSDLVFLEKRYKRRLFSYERKPLEEGQVTNPYHGNLLGVANPKGTDKRQFRSIQSHLAYIASRTEVITRDQLDMLL